MAPKGRDSRGKPDEGSPARAARGGPGTFAGTDYQLRVQVLRALSLIERQLVAPDVPLEIATEALLGNGPVEAWDFVVEPDTTAVEAKVKPTAEDIRAFATVAGASRASIVELVYGQRATGGLHFALERLQKLRNAARDAAQFAGFVRGAPARERELTALLGDDAFDVLHRLRFTNIPETHLPGQLEHAAQSLVGEHGPTLVARLFEQFSNGAGQRRRYKISDLVEEIHVQGWTLQLPSRTAVASALRPAAKQALLVLQRAEAPVHVSVLARAARVSESEMRQQLGRLASGGLVSETDDVWMPPRLRAEIHDEGVDEVLSRAIPALLEWVKDNPGHPALDGAVDAAVNLGREAFTGAPEVVAPMFRVLDKLLKRRGDKRLVFDVANRSVAAAGRAAIRTDAMVEAEAVALICGKSWVYQRIGQLGHARADGENSLRLGEQIGYTVNTAFCRKCLGRLYRMEAEQEVEPRRWELLVKSVECLEDAVDRFEALGRPGEVGDSCSLLARTLLVSGDLPGAAAALERAQQLLTDPLEKDYVDMLIVEGDLLAAQGAPEAAEQSYRRAVASQGEGSEFTEMRARAHHQLAKLLVGLRRRDEARIEFGRASKAYSLLREPHFAALSQLELMRMDGRLPERPESPEIGRLLEIEAPLVQVLAVQAHERALARLDERKALSFRKEATRGHWERMIDQARHEAARQELPW